MAPEKRQNLLKVPAIKSRCLSFKRFGVPRYSARLPRISLARLFSASPSACSWLCRLLKVRSARVHVPAQCVEEEERVKCEERSRTWCARSSDKSHHGEEESASARISVQRQAKEMHSAWRTRSTRGRLCSTGLRGKLGGNPNRRAPPPGTVSFCLWRISAIWNTWWSSSPIRRGRTTAKALKNGPRVCALRTTGKMR